MNESMEERINFEVVRFSTNKQTLLWCGPMDGLQKRKSRKRVRVMTRIIGPSWLIHLSEDLICHLVNCELRELKIPGD
jgi:hypothetical protein